MKLEEFIEIQKHIRQHNVTPLIIEYMRIENEIRYYDPMLSTEQFQRKYDAQIKQYLMR